MFLSWKTSPLLSSTTVQFRAVQLKKNDPEKYRQVMFSIVWVPFVPFSKNIQQERVKVAVNNWKVMQEMTGEQGYGAFEVSLLSVVRLVREVAPIMRARKWGRILTIQSVSVKQPVDGLLLSNAVRPGVAGLSKTLAPELGKDNITINVVCPGRIMTDRFLGGAKQAGMPVDEYVAQSARDVPLGRIGTPEEFANVVVFLASEKASYVTGVVIQVDGGMVRGIV